VNEQDLRTFVQKRLSKLMWPDEFLPLGYLPANAAGKISTNVLRKIVTGELSDGVLASLGSWKLERAQPSEPEKLRALIQDALTRGRPISFLSYWGAGRRGSIGDIDRVSLGRLKAYVEGARRVPQAPPELTLLFTDMHARNYRIPEARMQTYWTEIETHAQALGIRTARLSDLWSEARLLPAQIDAATRTPEFEAAWQEHPLRTRLIEQAQKYVEQGADAEQAARYYLEACAREGAAIVARYPSSVFLTYDHPDFDCVSPPMPKLYLHSVKEGASVKPWFVEDAPAAAPGAHRAVE